ncbi:LLM class F420-dependent oxidoreductase [Dietzia sp. 179-F 9C3 NHS]|uniref:LLM class F420-dependent oxidoreductase n=1 Tax=Dietzia sp. 179-F 9C3 NHS TaxID=3374295 RepID=UPI003879E7B1
MNPTAPYPARIAVQLQPQHAPDYQMLRDAVRRCEDAGVDVVFNWDHFFPLYGDPDGAHFECWTMLAAWAEQTERVEIGALVTCNTYRNPDLLADMARTVDHISGGRLILGLGGGWFDRDYTEYGYPFGTRRSRLDALGESLERIEARFARLTPPPTRDIPVLVGGGGEKRTLRHVARHADIWHSFVDVETYRHKASVLARHCDEVGRDPGTIERSTELGRAESAHEARRLADALYAEGVSLFTVGVSGPDYDLSLAEALVAWRDGR